MVWGAVALRWLRLQGLRSWVRGRAEMRERMTTMLRNGSDLGERALLRTVQVDAVSECLADVLRREAEKRSSAGQVAADRLDRVAEHSAELGHAIEAGRERVISSVARGQEASKREVGLAAASRKQLDECAAFVAQAAGAAAQARDDIRSRLRAEAAALAGVGAGVEAARVGVESALADSSAASSLIERSGKQITVGQYLFNFLTDSLQLPITQSCAPAQSSTIKFDEQSATNVPRFFSPDC
jgi:hypothetical protein